MATSSHAVPTVPHLAAAQSAAEAVHQASVNGVTVPINPFPPSPYISTPTSIPFATIFTGIFLFAVFAWLIYTLVVSYHWLRYGHRSWFAIPAIALHIFISGFFIIFALSGLV